MKTTIISVVSGLLLLVVAMIMLAWSLQKEPVKPAPVSDEKKVSCMAVTILKVDEEAATTYMEVDGDAPRQRIARSGKWGTTGDHFKYCE